MKKKAKRKVVVKKQSSYQKLKAEIGVLKQDIYKLVKGEFLPKLETESKWRMKFDTENIIMAGSPTIKKGKGIWDKIKKDSKKK